MRKSDIEAENYSQKIEFINNSKKKPSYPIGKAFKEYLQEYGREEKITVKYSDLLYWHESIPLYDKEGNDTLWRSVIYPQSDQDQIFKGLTEIYGLLKTGGNMEVIEHLTVAQVDYCQFGNSNPFRVKIKNTFNDVHDYFYVKKVDASRVYGLELEHILSPNRIFYIIDDDTIIEEHIMGIPGDMFIDDYLSQLKYQEVSLAKEFVKFNERCFVRLLGDMRGYNFVLEITQDFDNVQYRIRAMDFDQQSFEGRKNIYKPQFYKDNLELVELVQELMTDEVIQQYQRIEKVAMKKRYFASRQRTRSLLRIMRKDKISTNENIETLRKELSKHHNEPVFLNYNNMGDILSRHLENTLSIDVLSRNIVK